MIDVAPAGEAAVQSVPTAERVATTESAAESPVITESVSEAAPCCTNFDHSTEGVAMKSEFEALFVPPLTQPEPLKQPAVPTMPLPPSAEPARPAWVELADQIVAEMQSPQASVRVLHEMFERSDDLEDLVTTPSGNLPSAAQIFDSFVYAPKSPMSERLAANFQVIALPNQAVRGQVRAGDFMIRRAEGPSAHVAVVASPGLMTLDSLNGEGLIAESSTPGQYVHVVEGGAFRHESEDKYARQLTDSFGRVLNDIVLLRLASAPPAPTVVTINQTAPANDDPLALLPDESAEIAAEAATFSDNNDYFDMTELPPVTTRREIRTDAMPLKYTATTGRLPIKNSVGQIEAQMFYVAYTLDGQDVTKRPLTFAFNGGPGSASLWLHMGAMGPRKVALQPNGFLPPAPYRIQNNPYTLLDKSDLVFIDAIGTGFSRAATLATFEKFWGVRGDIEAFSEFIRLYITRNERWGSPLFLLGESYGTLRAAGIAGYLSTKGISFNGIGLLSTVLNYQTLEVTKTNDQPYMFLIPTFTMIAGYHHKLPPDLDKDVNRARQEAEKWAAAEYAEALAKGDSLTSTERQETLEQMARFTGLGKDVIDQANLRIDVSKFTRYLLLDKKLRVGRFDGRFTGTDPGGLLESHFYDPTEAATHPPFTSVFNNYLRTELGFKTDLPYYTRAQDADADSWNWGSAIEGFPDTATAIRQAILRNPYLKVLVMEGYYDLATPFSAANYTIDHLDLPTQRRRNISFATYEAGHMVYLPEAGLKKMKADVANFIAQSVAPRPISGTESTEGVETGLAESDVSVLASATREMSLQGIVDGRLRQLPTEFLEAILTRGESDANELTNRVFWQKHPEDAGKKLDEKDHSQQALRNDWARIFLYHVKPLIWLRAMINELDKYRGTLPREFLLGWIAVESDGNLKSTTPLNELGYFQIMWQGGEAKDQLHMTLEEFPRLATDPEYSIEKGVALAEAYRQYILKNYPTIADGSDLLWRLTKARHAASGVQKAALRKLQAASIPITWAAASNVMPSWMLDNIAHTMIYAAKLKPLADLVPVPAGPAAGPRTDQSAISQQPPAPVSSPEPAESAAASGDSASDYIRWVQSSLNQILSLQLPVDGRFDEKTRDAIRQFQRGSDQTIDGVPGPGTLGALVRAGAASPVSSGTKAGTTQMVPCPEEVYETVSGFHRYSNSVDALPPNEQQKVRMLADRIVRSFQADCQRIGTVKMIGHADRDPIRESAEPGFELRVSIERAEAIEAALRKRINSQSISSGLNWQRSGMGSTVPVVSNPATEVDRSRNRRVEVTLIPVPSPEQRSGVNVKEQPVLVTSPPGPLRSLRVVELEQEPSAGPRALEIPYQGSVEQSVYAVARWFNITDDRRAAAVAHRLVVDQETSYEIKGKPVTADQYEAFARSIGKVKLYPGAVQFLSHELNATPDQIRSAAEDEKKFGKLLRTADTIAFFGTDRIPLDPQGSAAESRRARTKRTGLRADDKVLENPQIAQLYIVLIEEYAKPALDKNALQEMAKGGLDASKLQAIIANNAERRLVTNYFTQGVLEYRQAGGTDIAGQFFRLEECLLGQLTFGNPTVVKNELRIGVGLPEGKMGLVYRPDGILYYESEMCIPLRSFAGDRYRDPGFKAAAKEPGLINIDLIRDPVLRDFFRLLRDRYKTPALIFAKGAEVYWENNEEVNRRIRQGLPEEILQSMADALKILAGFLVWRSAAMAFVRSGYPALQAVGAGMELFAEAAQYVLQIEFLGSIEEKLVGAGMELAHVTPKDEGGDYESASQFHLKRAADLIRPIVAETVTQLVQAGILKGLSRAKAVERAKAKLESITERGERTRLRCSSPCEFVQEAAEFSKSIGKDYYDATLKSRGAKPGTILTDANYPTVEIHPDGNIYGEHVQLLKFIKDAGLSKSGEIGYQVESHHLMEDHQMEQFGVPRNRGRCVSLEKSDHNTFSAWMRGLLNRTTRVDIDELYDLHREMYQDNGHPEYTTPIRDFLRQWKNDIRKRYDSGNVPGGRAADFPARKARVFQFLDSL
jgi:carboxypeptidase C (cathepsin A)/outer membrane protein OmpA-like peptidoglycan-associated protein